MTRRPREQDPEEQPPSAHAEMLNAYTRIPRLSAVETNALVVLAQGGSQRARNKLIEGNMRLVLHIANKAAFSYRVPVEDLIAAGVMGSGSTQSGLIRAIEKFDPTRGACFSTYMVPWIRDGVQRAALQFRGRESLEGAGCHDESPGTPRTEHTPFDDLAEKQDAATLAAAVNGLEQPQRKLVFFLRDRRNAHITNLNAASRKLCMTKDSLRGLHNRSVAALKIAVHGRST